MTPPHVCKALLCGIGSSVCLNISGLLMEVLTSWPRWISAHVLPHKILRSLSTAFFSRLATCGLTVLPSFRSALQNPVGKLSY